jgi:hypothetical protein
VTNTRTLRNGHRRNNYCILMLPGKTIYLSRNNDTAQFCLNIFFPLLRSPYTMAAYVRKLISSKELSNSDSVMTKNFLYHDPHKTQEKNSVTKGQSQPYTCWCNNLLLSKWQMPQTVLNYLEDIYHANNQLAYD